MKEIKLKIPTNRVDLFQGVCDTHCFKIYGVPRDCVQIAINEFDPDMRLHGIYFLVNTNQSRDSKRYIYIGQTIQGPHRLVNHRQSRDHWNYAYMFLADKEFMDNTLINELEAIEIKRFQNSSNFSSDNSRCNRATISPKTDDFSRIIEEIMSFFGYSLCENSTMINDSETEIPEIHQINTNNIRYDENYFLANKPEIIKNYYFTLKELFISKGLIPKYNKINISFKNSKKESIVNLIIYKSYIEVVLGIKLGNIVDPLNITYDISTRKWTAMQYAFKYFGNVDLKYVEYLVDQALN